jgi:hypothetical protein
MLIVALVLAVVGLAALVTAVVTSNELIAWVCIAASAIGVILLIVDAVRERSRRDEDVADDLDGVDDATSEPVYDEDYPEQIDDVPDPQEPAAEHVDEVVDEEHKSH